MEKETQRAAHLLILTVYSIATFAMIGESFLLGWETGPIVLFVIALIFSWVIYFSGKVPVTTRLWLYVTFTMLSFFFYGIHETSIFDLAPVIIVIIILYAVTESQRVIAFSVGTYFMTIAYDFIFVRMIELSPLVISRILLHFLLVIVAAKLVSVEIKRIGEDRKKAEKQIKVLEQANRRTEDFLANVSHELRTPINVVTGITSVMLKNEEDKKKRKNLTSIQAAGHRLFGQISDILDYTEIDTKRIKVSQEKYMITSLVNDIIMGQVLTEKKEKLELVFDIAPSIPSVLLGDGKKIKKILNHLIENALKYTQTGGIYIRIYALPKEYGINLCLQVKDTGVGISQDELEKIRIGFYQSNSGRDRRAGGLGLGLSIVSGLVSAMEGFIQVESTLGQGTSISISIPQKISDETPSMMVKNPGAFSLACYSRMEKYKVPAVREYYNEMIAHLVEGVNIPLHWSDDISGLERLLDTYELTHLFVGKEEYEENPSVFAKIDPRIKVIIIVDEHFTESKDCPAIFLKKPFYSLPIVTILNAGEAEQDSSAKKREKICPGVRVLVVDDEPMNLMVAEGIFKEFQMNVTTAESGRKAINLCRKNDYDLIFLDHMMPEMDGIETLRQIRQVGEETDREFTIIAFTANAVSGAREMFLQKGFDEFVAKPVESLEIERVLRKVLPKAAIVYADKTQQPEPEELVVQESSENGEDSDPDAVGDTAEDKMSRLERKGIQVQTGIDYSGGDEEFYIELLTRFAEDAKIKEDKMGDFLKQGDIANYEILVHSLKSSAKMIGAEELSEHAKQAEEAAKNRDNEYLQEHHGELMAEYGETVSHIVEVVGV